MSDGGDVITQGTIKYELEGRFRDLRLGKTHFSVRYEPAPRIARIGVCLAEFNWDNRMAAIEAILKLESDHADEFAVEFDVIPLDAVTDEAFADA